MNVMMKSSMEQLELVDGEKVNLTLNFSRLLLVRNARKDIYAKYNSIMMNGPKDVFDNVTVLYTAYLCALDDIGMAMSYESFLENLPPYPNVINTVVSNLAQPKKREASEAHSEANKEKQEE